MKISDSKLFAIWLTAIVVATCIAYANSLQVPFLFDDPLVLQQLSGKSLGEAVFSSGHRPLFNLTIALNQRLPSLGIWSYHLPSILAHIISSVLLFLLVYKLLVRNEFKVKTSCWLGGGIALLWSLHPLQTEAVTYISQRGEVFMGLFAFAALYCLVQSCNSAKSWLWQSGCLVCLFLGACSKEAMVSAPLILMLFDRVFLVKSWKQVWKQHRIFCMGLVAGSVLFLGFLFLKVGVLSYFTETFYYNPWQYLVTQGEVILHYLKLTLYPDAGQLCFDYAWPISVNSFQAFGACLLVGILLTGALILCWKRPKLGFAGLWLFIWLAPRSSFMPQPDIAVEHRMYMPLAGVIALVTMGTWWLLAELVKSSRLLDCKRELWQRRGLILFVLAAATILGWQTILRNRVYHSTLSLWLDTAMKRPENIRALNYAGIYLATEGHLAEAEDCFRRAIAIRPTFSLAINNLGETLKRQKRYDEAIALYNMALENIQERPDDKLITGLRAVTIANVAEILLLQRKDDGASQLFRRALKMAPDNPDLHVIVGRACLSQGEDSKAKEHFRLALKCSGVPEKTKDQIRQQYERFGYAAPAEFR